jgi:hypothetical protein
MFGRMFHPKNTNRKKTCDQQLRLSQESFISDFQFWTFFVAQKSICSYKIAEFYDLFSSAEPQN